MTKLVNDVLNSGLMLWMLKFLAGLLVTLVGAGGGWFVSKHCEQDEFQTKAINIIESSLTGIAAQLDGLENERRVYWSVQEDLLRRLEARLDRVSNRVDLLHSISKEGLSSP